MSEINLDLERQVKAKDYARISRRLMVVDLAFSTLYLLLWLVTGWSSSLRDWLNNLTSSHALAVAIFVAVFGGIFFIIDVPLSFYSGFTLPHRFGQSTQTLKGWIVDQLKSLALSVVLGLLLIELVYWLLLVSPDRWWLWVGILLFFINVIMANLAPVLIAPIFYKFEPLENTNPDLAGRLLRLAQQTGTHVRGVYKFDMSTRTKSANAALFGLWNTRRIILGDTLINEFSPDEVETILAHELGHHVHKDLPLGLFASTLITMIGLFIAAIGMRFGISIFHLTGPADVAGMPLLAVVMGAYGMVTLPLSNAFSRWRETLADRFALETTHNSRAYASALTRLANQNLAEVDPEPWVEFVLYSHPALNKRIHMADHFSSPGE